MKYIVSILSLLLFGLPLRGATIESATPAYADVLTAYNTTMTGDVLKIKGPGTNDWGTNYLTITKAITITSSSTNSVKLTSTNGTAFFYLNASVPRFRLHDVYTSFVTFDQTTDRVHFKTGKTNNNVRIDHNRFEYGKRVVFSEFRTWGVVDHNDVYNCDVGFAPQGSDSRTPAETNSGDYSWSIWLANPVLGTTNDLVFESNYLHRDVGTEENELLYGFAGGHATFRFNTIYSTNANLDLIDAHGRVAASVTSRGTIGYEIYGNDIFCSASGRLMNMRGGTHLIYSNRFISPQVGQSSIELRDEGITSNGGIPSPYPDYHTNSFYWANTWNGAAMTPNIIHPSVIILDQTVFFRPPTNITDKWFSYTPLIFPHPLVAASDSGPTFPITLQGRVTMTGTIGNGTGSGRPARALVAFTDFPATTARSDFTGEVGVQFTQFGSRTCTQLGRYMLSGNTQTHTNTLRASDGTLLASATVNMSGQTVGTWVYGTLSSPVTLTNTATYHVLSTEINGGDTWYDQGAPTVSGDFSVSDYRAAYYDGTIHTVSASQTYVPVNLKFTNP